MVMRKSEDFISEDGGAASMQVKEVFHECETRVAGDVPSPRRNGVAILFRQRARLRTTPLRRRVLLTALGLAMHGP